MLKILRSIYILVYGIYILAPTALEFSVYRQGFGFSHRCQLSLLYKNCFFTWVGEWVNTCIHFKASLLTNKVVAYNSVKPKGITREFTVRSQYPSNYNRREEKGGKENKTRKISSVLLKKFWRLSFLEKWWLVLHFGWYDLAAGFPDSGLSDGIQDDDPMKKQNVFIVNIWVDIDFLRFE